jgi:hypothetical protein
LAEPVDPIPLSNSLNLLVVPWPRDVRPNDFRAVPNVDEHRLRRAERQPWRPRSGLFTYQRDAWSGETYARLLCLIAKARQQVGRVDGLVFPELALTSIEWNALRRHVGSGLPDMLIAGVGESAKTSSDLGRNYAGVAALSLGRSKDGREDYVGVPYEQPKHHRWLLDGTQLVNYHLGANLDGTRLWWEGIDVNRREVYFLGRTQWLTMCVLLCEDLARQDPVAELLRTVGPNLIVVLLMDGPQLASRWSGRYATVLADDPGSAVLTLTSIGMAERSRPPSLRSTDGQNRIIGLWKDAKRGETIPIHLDPGTDAAVLTINRSYSEERTLDGRWDDKRTAHLELTGIHCLRVDDSKPFEAQAEELFLTDRAGARLSGATPRSDPRSAPRPRRPGP